MNENNNDNDEDDEFPFGGLFSPMDKIFADFDRFFSGFSSVFSIPSQEFNNDSAQLPSRSLRDEVLKQDNQNKHYGDENLDSTIEQRGLRGAFPSTFSSSSTMTSMHRETTLSGKCIIEKKIQQSLNQNEKNKTETVTKICGDKHHTTIKQDGNIVREYGNATLDELNQIDSSPSPTNDDDDDDDDDGPMVGGDKYSDLFKKLFS
ncbi:hypothetical protein I4U23_011866 [Adineta vaga]|nr:hypothetical protein I4U23_011866 [Adineta vaga]